MKSVELKKGIYWVGAIDWDLRNFHGYLTQRGSSYNAYLIVDEKTALIDTVKAPFCGEMLERIRQIIDPEKIDYVVSNHAEMDHSGALPEVMKICTNAQLVVSPHGEKALNNHFQNTWPFKVVQTGDVIALGRRNLHVVLMPMVHWPDSMALYIPEDKLLLPNDAFGQHVASSERFDDELGWDIAHEESAKYYANIALIYSKQVKKVLGDLEPFDIEMIAPSHGVIWRTHVQEIIAEYKKWAANVTDDKAVIVYDTMWGSTKLMAEALEKAFENQGLQVVMMNLQACHISDVMTEILNAKYICVGSPTLNGTMLPTVAGFLCYLKGLAPQGRTAMSFGSYGWGGQSVAEIHQVLESCGFEMLEPIKIKYIPTPQMLEEIKAKAWRN